MNNYYFLNECKELKKLITENPDLPLMFFAEDTGYDNAYVYMSCSLVKAEKGEVLDCYQDINDEKLFASRDEFEEEVEYALAWMDGTKDLSDKEFDELVKSEIAKYDDKWKDCIIVYVGN